METFNPSIAMPYPYAYTFTNAITSNYIYQNSASNSPAPTSPWMDSRIWSGLPQGLMDRILAFLPPRAFFRARAVCKRWYALLYSNSFLQLCLQVCPRRHWFIFFHHKTPSASSIVYKHSTPNGPSGQTPRAYLLDPDELTWYTIPFPLIPPGYSSVASSGGLVCWASDEPGPKSLILHNPLVGSVAHLPPTLRPRLFPSVGLSITGSSIDLTLAGDDLISPYAVKNLTTESFHVDAGGFYSVWATTSSLPRLCSMESGQMAHCQGRFYCMNHSPFSVLAYDIASNNWWKIQAPMRRFLRSPTLVETQGRVLLVAAVEKSKLNVPRSLRLWALQPCGTQWVEIERMPQQLYAQFGEVEVGRGFHCVGHGEFIVIMIKGVNKGLMFDIERKRWVWMPCCPNDQGEEGTLHAFAYEPRLATPVITLVDQLALPFQSFSG